MTQSLLQRLTTGELTAREREILSLVASGLESKEIARELFLSHDTVRTHVAHTLAKLGARSRAQAVGIAVRRGLID
jgi:two-component system, NarL family, nitrate/nitrite response regulator NarL